MAKSRRRSVVWLPALVSGLPTLREPLEHSPLPPLSLRRQQRVRVHTRVLARDEAKLKAMVERVAEAEREAKDAWMRSQIQTGKASKEEMGPFLKEKQAQMDEAVRSA